MSSSHFIDEETEIQRGKRFSQGLLTRQGHDVNQIWFFPSTQRTDKTRIFAKLEEL